MVISSVNNAAAPYDPTAGTTARVGGDGNLGKEDFLKLLIAQMTNQDPLSPTDPTEFVGQLTQFSSLEQLIGVREGLDLVAITQTAGTSAQMVSFIGKTVSYDGGEFTLAEAGQSKDIDFRLSGAAEEVSVRIFDAKGNTLREIQVGGRGAGPGSVTFDGKDADGNPLAAGSYKIEVNASDAQGTTVKATTLTQGVVTGVTFEAGYPELVLADGTKVGLSQVLQVLGTAAQAAAGGGATTTDPDAPGDGAATNAQGKAGRLADLLARLRGEDGGSLPRK